MQFVLKVTTLLFLQLAASSRYLITGPAVLNFLEVNDCPGKKLPIITNITLNMYNKTTKVINIHIQIPLDLDESVGLSIRGTRWSNGAWRKNFYNVESEVFCDYFERFCNPYWHDLKIKMDLPTDKCGIEKGIYEARNIYIDITKMKTQFFFKGKLKALIRFMQYSKPIFCKEFIVEILPKEIKD